MTDPSLFNRLDKDPQKNFTNKIYKTYEFAKLNDREIFRFDRFAKINSREIQKISRAG